MGQATNVLTNCVAICPRRACQRGPGFTRPLGTPNPKALAPSLKTELHRVRFIVPVLRASVPPGVKQKAVFAPHSVPGAAC